MGWLRLSPRLGAAGVVALVAIDVVLVGMALRSNHVSGIDTSAVGSAAIDVDTSSDNASSTPSPTPSAPLATPTATRAATTTPAVQAAPLQTMLVAIDNQRAWRVRVGSCAAGGATVGTTTNGGKTWSNAKAPLRMIVRVRPTDGQAAFIVGAGSSCAAELHRTVDGGDTWGSGSSAGGAWFRDPDNPRAVRAPSASTSQPCGKKAVLDLAVLSPDAARVLCDDGRIRSTTNTGSSWTDSAKANGAVALAVLLANPAQTYVALLDASGCNGVQIRRADQSVATSCIATPVPSASGQIALSLVDGGGWLAVGDTTMRSTDKLVTWGTS
jgi:hypothetical protein